MRVAYVDGQQAASADQLRARIEGSGGSGQARIAISRQERGLQGRTDRRAWGTERHDGLLHACWMVYIVTRHHSQVCAYV